jgi:prolyl oligopeptidase
MNHRRALLVLGLLISIGTIMAADPIAYPNAKKVDLVEEYHGTQVPDPYRWLEDDVRTSPEVRAWVEAENKVTFGYLNTLKDRETFRKRLTTLWNYERVTPPVHRGHRYWYLRNDGLQNQAVLMARDSANGVGRVILDPNAWSKDGTIALAGWAPSDNGRLLAYGVAEAGSDWTTWRVLDLVTSQLLPDELKWVKFNAPSWVRDGSGLYYARFDKPSDGQQFQSLNLNMKIYHHTVGSKQETDKLVMERPDNPEWGFQTETSDDGTYLFITTHVGTDHRYRVSYRDLKNPNSPLTDLITEFKNEWSFMGNRGSVVYFKTNLDAPLGRIVSTDLKAEGARVWREIVPQAKDKLDGASLTANRIVATYLRDASTRVMLFTLEGAAGASVELPGIGSADGFDGTQTDTDTYYSYSDFTTPTSIFRLDTATGKSDAWYRPKVAFNPLDYETKQVFVTSKDGTRVPMFISSKKGLKLTGDNPVILYGYGGFNISQTPAFRVSRLAWLEMGGVFAVANLRGGGEYGEAWHKAGTKTNKQNVFDDFIASAEFLIREKYTSPARLAIQGGSNGGLLVGAAMTQRPELFGACLPAVGVMDMLRFQKFTAGRYWVDDYGSSDNKEEFAALLKYSPYHNLKPGTSYPATLITTADTDDRVVPGHSFKFAAMAQACHKGPNPLLIRIETKAGHGAGKPTAMQIEEIADVWAFTAKALGMNP